MLTKEDKEEIKRLIVEVVAESGPPLIREKVEIVDVKFADTEIEEVTFTNPKSGEKQVLKATLGLDPIVDVTARAMEVFGTREKALRWLKTPVRSLGDQTPLSLLNSPEGVARVEDALGRVEHGVW